MAERTSAQKLKEIQRVRAMTGASGASAGQAQGGQQPDHGGGLLDTLKEVGGTSLRALSVPQAALFTSGAKLGGANVSWKNAGGDFYRADNGLRGVDNILNNAGVGNKWARLGIGLAADPLWFVGGGLVKGAKAAVEVEKTASAAATSVKESKAIINKLARNAVRTKSPKIRDAHLRNIEKEKKKLVKYEAIVKKEKHNAKVDASDLRDVAGLDKYGRVTGVDDAMRKVRVAMTQQESRKGMNYAVRFGAGKFSKKLNTGISAQKGLLGRKSSTAFKTGLVVMKPIEKVAHALRRSGSELSDAVPAAMLKLADDFGMTSTLANGGKEIDEATATLLGTYRAARQVNENVGNSVKGWLEHNGQWTHQHDELIRAMDERNDMFKLADNLKPDTRIADAKKRLATATSAHKDAEARLAAQDTARNSKRLTKAEEALQQAAHDLKMLEERGAYTKVGKSDEARKAEVEARRARVLKGIEAPGSQYRRVKDPKKLSATREMYDNPFSTVTMDEYVESLVKSGMDEADAQSLAQTIASGLEAKGLPNFLDETRGGVPEWNAFALAGRRETEHIMAQVDTQIVELMAIAGISKKTEVGKKILFGGGGGPLANSKVGNQALGAIASFKKLLTTVNPSHYIRNLTGDYLNSLVNGNIRNAAKPLGALPQSRNSKLANAEVWQGEGRIDRAALDAVHDIGGRQYTGAELMALSRMVGLGRGYVGTDIAIMNEAFARAGSKPKEFYAFMSRINVKRENAQRMHTWIQHMKAGDDPIEAGIKTLRVHFDYSQLTEFERLILRNTLLFYTWMKRNLALQSGGVFTRPGLYNAYNTMEGARPKIPNEPDYFSHQNAIPIPGFGAVNVGAPIGDLRKFELSFDAFRRDVLGAVTPPIRLPSEMATNQQFFTGQRIQDYEGQIKPTWYAQLAKSMGVPLTETTQKEGGGKGAGINPYLAYTIGQLTGPQAGNVQSLSNPDAEGSLGLQGLGRFIGISPQVDQPEKFARAAKYLAAKKKADATRAKNAQRD